MIGPHSMQGSTKASAHSKRKGIVTVLVILVLVLMSGLLAEYVHRVVKDRRQIRSELQRSQTQQLAAAGIDRMHKLRTESTDDFEDVWKIPSGVIHKTNSGTVSITVKQGVATVIAKYPDNQDLPIKVTRTIRLAQ